MCARTIITNVGYRIANWTRDGWRISNAVVFDEIGMIMSSWINAGMCGWDSCYDIEGFPKKHQQPIL